MNKKVKNATSLTYEGIKFKSKQELNVYKLLISNGFNPHYEEKTFCLFKGFKPSIPFFTKSKGSGVLKSSTSKLRDITYTPDFTFMYKDYLIIVEVKGFQNDVYPIKRKLFRRYLETIKTNCIFFEIFTIANTIEMVNILKTLK
jgi:hypothetical protein